MTQACPLNDIRAGFLAECEELMERLVDALADPTLFAAGGEALHRAFRAVHTIKGGAAALGHEALATDAHRFEERLDRLRAGSAADADLGQLLDAADRLSAHIAELPRPGNPADGVAEPGDWTLTFRPADALYASGNEPLHLLSALRALGGAVTCDPARLPPLDSLDPEGACLAWSVRLPATLPEADIRDLFEFVEDLCDLSLDRIQPQTAPPPGPPAPPTGAEAATIRVDPARVDRLLDLAGEMAIAQTALSTALRAAGLGHHAHPASALETFAALTHELQDAVMAIRTQPIKPLFQRMARTLREAAGRAGKSARLICEGEATEVDRAIIEQLAEPLTHMVRNAADHGLESPADRARAGKPRMGEVRLSAANRSGRFIVELADDGAGIDRRKVRETAVRRGLIAPDRTLSDAETDALLFEPGFSTAAEVTALSGRGVGMDAVRTAIAGLGGRITIASTPGEGTRFALSLPLTLAVLDGMLVSAAGQTFVLPLASILETTLVDTPDRRAGPGAASSVRLQDRHVPLVGMADILVPGTRPDPGQGTAIAVLIADEDDHRLALRVDDILEQTQVVVKDLRRNCGPVPGISAATILGDGRVALIADPGALLKMAAQAAMPPADPVR